MRAKFVSSLTPGVLTLALLAIPGSTSGAQASSNPAFSIVSVKLSPDSEADDWGIGIRGRNFWAVHVTAEELIEWAYGINARQIEQAPPWLATERFDLDGLPESGAQPSREQYRTMLQSALAERFAFRFHPSKKVLPVYVLSIANGGLKVPGAVDPYTGAGFRFKA